jgi:CheY-like chemotaxis protein
MRVVANRRVGDAALRECASSRGHGVSVRLLPAHRESTLEISRVNRTSPSAVPSQVQGSSRSLAPGDTDDLRATSATSVLVVEDDADLREAINDVLRSAGYGVVTAADGNEALAVARQQPPSLIITDLMMPGMSGWQLLDVLRTDAGLAAIPVFIMTAAGNAWGLPGGYPVFVKPLRIADLLRAVRTYIPVD